RRSPLLASQQHVTSTQTCMNAESCRGDWRSPFFWRKFLLQSSFSTQKSLLSNKTKELRGFFMQIDIKAEVIKLDSDNDYDFKVCRGPFSSLSLSRSQS
ncbi:MAG: hypothetical protein ACOC3Y_03015, partial [Desulfohalobiaceae bacterium]